MNSGNEDITLAQIHDSIVDYLRRYVVEVSGDVRVDRGSIQAYTRWLAENGPENAADEFRVEE